MNDHVTIVSRMKTLANKSDVLEMYLTLDNSPVVVLFTFKFKHLLPYSTESYDYRTMLESNGELDMPLSSLTGDPLPRRIHDELTNKSKSLEYDGNTPVPQWAVQTIHRVTADPVFYLLLAAK